MYYHCSDLKGHGIFEETEIKTRPLLYLLQAVDERISVHMELPRGLCNIEIVLEEPIDRGSRVLIK